MAKCGARAACGSRGTLGEVEGYSGVSWCILCACLCHACVFRPIIFQIIRLPGKVVLPQVTLIISKSHWWTIAFAVGVEWCNGATCFVAWCLRLLVAGASQQGCIGIRFAWAYPIWHTEAGQCVAYDVFCTYFEYVKKSNYLPTHTADHGCNMFQHTASNIFVQAALGHQSGLLSMSLER